MTRAIAHRGPDGEGFWHADGVVFGHRRLSIIDLSDGGSQPMTAAEGRYALLYNGELYNFPEIRRELSRLGHQFVSRSDSEVVLRALIEWGADAVPRFNGMFALAFYDSFRRELILARDRYGIKPLYIWDQGGRLAFASESKAFRPLPGFRSDLDLAGLVEYLNFQNFFTERTLFQGVSTFPAGHVATLQVGPDGQIVRPYPKALEQYWDFHFAEPTDRLSPDEYLAELDRLFTGRRRAAARRRRASQLVPVGRSRHGRHHRDRLAPDAPHAHASPSGST